MRSVPAGSFQRLSDLEALWAAWLQCRSGKRRQPRMAAFDLDADSAILQLHRVLRKGSYHPSPYQLKVVRDPKTLLVAAPAITDRIVLTEACSAIQAWLKAERGLELKSIGNVIRPTSEPSTYLGFRISRAGVALGPKAKRRLRQRLRRAHAIGSSRLARSLQAYRGMMLSIG